MRRSADPDVCNSRQSAARVADTFCGVSVFVDFCGDLFGELGAAVEYGAEGLAAGLQSCVLHVFFHRGAGGVFSKYRGGAVGSVA
jgi:hypothetical protein